MTEAAAWKIEGVSVMWGDANSKAGIRKGEILAGKYRVERVLGVGDTGLMVAAHPIALDDKVALKFLLPEALANSDAVARFAHTTEPLSRARRQPNWHALTAKFSPSVSTWRPRLPCL
jgi:hypothetical protein